MKRSPRAEGPRKRRKSRRTGEVCAHIREDQPRGGEAPPFPELPARPTATGAVVRLCAPLPAPPAATPAARRAVRFSEVYTLEEIAQSLDTLAEQCEAKAQQMPAKAISFLQMAALARISARELRAEQLPY